MEARELQTDDEVAAAFPLMASLRDRIRADTFLAEVRRQQALGYRLFAGFAEGGLVALAGGRPAHTLSRGPHLFLDDLVTLTDERGRGHGRALLGWLDRWAMDRGLPRIYLDSRDTALGFYQRVGFTPLTSTPCWRACAPSAA